MDVHHPEFVGVAACLSRPVLATGEVTVLLRLELYLTCLLPEHMKGLLWGHGHQLACGTGSRLFARCDL